MREVREATAFCVRTAAIARASDAVRHGPVPLDRTTSTIATKPRASHRTPMSEPAPHRNSMFRDRLLAWYDAHRRDLPWRDAADPWAVWVSEIMLQQTRVETVRGYFERWMKRFPSVQDLAAADIDEVLGAWQGLGYYSRARNLHRAATHVAAHCDGTIPDTVDALRALPGVGPYTAGAIASIAFGRQAPIVDGNVMRVIARLDGIDLDMRRTAGQRAVWTRCGELVPADRPGDFNQALMELGATVCSPRSPRCDACPVADHCTALADDRVLELPVKGRRTPPRAESRAALVIRDERGRVLVAKRPAEGLLAGLWEFPLVAPDDAMDSTIAALAGHGSTRVALDDVVHVFSHIRLTATPLVIEATRPAPTPSLPHYATLEWTPAHAVDGLARSRLMQKLQEVVADGQQGLFFG